MITLPNRNSPFISKLGTIVSVWASYLQQFTQAPPNITNLNVTASPFAYTSSEPGHLAITSGTVSDITLTRGSITLNFGAGTNVIIPVAINDTVTITYSVLPAINFIPSYGQNTNG